MNDETSLAVYVASAGSKHIDWVLKKEMGDSEQDRISLRTIKVYCRFEAEGYEITLPKVNHATTHRFGQIISGWLGDKFDAFKLITIGLVLSAAMNVLLPLFPEPYIMVVFWAINGFAQALIYPPLMKITSHYLSEQNYARACLFVTIGSHAATLLMYLAAPMMIALSSWKLVFFVSFGCAVVFLVIWQFYSRSIKRSYGKPSERPKTKDEAAEEAESVSLKTLLISSGLIIIMFAVVMQGFLRDGIATWMPAYLTDVFSLSNEVSILTTVILSIFSIFSAYVILAIRNCFCKNELKLAGITFLAAVAAIALTGFVCCFAALKKGFR